MRVHDILEKCSVLEIETFFRNVIVDSAVSNENVVTECSRSFRSCATQPKISCEQSQ